MLVGNFTKFIKYYGVGRKIKLLGFFALSLIAGFLEFTGIALVYPFILLIVQPEQVAKFKGYAAFSKIFHIHDFLTATFVLGVIVIFVFVAKNMFMILSLYLQNKFVNNWKLAISKRFMRYYLYSSYKNSLQSAPSEKIYNLTFLISQSIDGFIFRSINLITNSIIVIMVLSLLFIKFPLAACFTLVFAAVCLMFQSRFFKKKILDISRKFATMSVSSNQKMIENVTNLKEIKILSAEDYFYNDYLSTQKSFSDVLFRNNFYLAIPPYIIEIFAVLSLLVLAGIISIQTMHNSSWMVASYAVVAAVLFRVAPALNRIQSSLNGINASRDFAKMMILEYEKQNLDLLEEKSDFKAKFDNSIRLIDICFSYKSNKPVIENLNLEIKKGEFIGIIGLSGAGKSTLADILMGLLPVDSGEIYVDDIGLDQRNFSSLRKLVGYVPQQINILDGSVKINVAWGVKEEDIDEEKVINALKKAQIYDFVSEMDGGINSKAIVGSMGLSQGQKQRLAIARALYKESEILIFDEATSSLDVETEHGITLMLNAFKGEKTVVAIAHRLSTLKSCDRLVYLKNGKVADTGTFDELAQKHPDFEKLIKLSSLNNY